MHRWSRSRLSELWWTNKTTFILCLPSSFWLHFHSWINTGGIEFARFSQHQVFSLLSFSLQSRGCNLRSGHVCCNLFNRFLSPSKSLGLSRPTQQNDEQMWIPCSLNASETVRLSASSFSKRVTNVFYLRFGILHFNVEYFNFLHP